jgi:hypothetical protein
VALANKVNVTAQHFRRSAEYANMTDVPGTSQRRFGQGNIEEPSSRVVPSNAPRWQELPELRPMAYAPELFRRAAPTNGGKPVAMPGNAGAFADRGVPLGLALKDGAFGSAAELGRFIDEYVAYTAARPEMKQLHEDATRVGPEILATRLDADDAEQERRVGEQQARDRIAPLQVRAPLPMQQRAAIGELSVPIARASVFVGKFVPVAGSLLVLAEVVTGRDIAGLGEKLDNADRALDAALLVAPFAATALAKGARGAAELFRLARATGRSIDETRAFCRVALEVSRNEKAVRDGITAAKAGRAMTAEQKAAMGLVGKAGTPNAEGPPLRGRFYKANVTSDERLPAGWGVTDKYGNVRISPHGSAKDIALAQNHEAVHAFLSPKALNGLREFRANAGMTAYEHSALCKYLEEALAESYAQVKVNGIRALPTGLRFPITNGYVKIGDLAGEVAIGTVSYATLTYDVYLVVDSQ